MEEAQASQLIPVNCSISLTLLLHQTLFPPSHHSPDQTSMIKFLPRLAQEGAGIAIAIASHPWFGRQAKPGRSSQVKAGGRRALKPFVHKHTLAVRSLYLPRALAGLTLLQNPSANEEYYNDGAHQLTSIEMIHFFLQTECFNSLFPFVH